MSEMRHVPWCSILLAATPTLAATYFVSARNVECAGGMVKLARRWDPLMAEGFDKLPEDWQIRNYESNLQIGLDSKAHGGAGALMLTYAKEKDTAWELISPPTPVKGLARVRLCFWLRSNKGLANIAGHKGDYLSLVEFRQDDGTVAGSLPVNWGKPDGAWHEVVVAGEVPPASTVAVVRLGWDWPDIGAGEYVALDDLELLGQTAQPTYESSGEWTSAPVEVASAPSLTVAWQADVPPRTGLQVALQGLTQSGWQSIGQPLKQSGSHVPLPATTTRVRAIVSLTSQEPTLSPTVRSLALAIGKRTDKQDQFAGVDIAAPIIASFGPTRTAEPQPTLRLQLADGGTGIDALLTRMWMDGVPAVFAPQQDGGYTYRPSQPLRPPALGVHFTGWRTRNHAGALAITKTAADGAGQAIRVTREAGPTDTAFSLTSPPVPVIGGSDYALSFRYRSSVALSETNGFGGGLQWLDKTGQPLGELVPIKYGPQSDVWRDVQQKLTGPPDAAAAVIHLGWDNPNLSGGQVVEFADPKLDGPRPERTFGPNLHQIRVVAEDFAGNCLDQTRFLLIKEPLTKGVVTIRDDGVTLIDGKPFFPIGIYSVSKRPDNNNSYDDAFRELKAAGFNLAHTYASARNADFTEFYQAAARQGMKLWVSPETGNNSKDAAGAAMTVAQECNEPALLAWYLADDTAGYITPDELRTVHQAVMDVDPYHMTTQADGISALNDDRYIRYVNSTTGFLPELYPIRNKTGNHVAEIIRGMKNVQAGWQAAGRKTPVWAIIQDFEGWGWQRFPTNEEERLMVYLAIIHGAQGMTWYTYAYRDDKHGAPWDPKVWAYLKQIAGELSSLSDVLTSRDPKETVQTTILSGPEKGDLDYPSMNLRLKHLRTQGVRQGKWTLLAANSSEHAVKVRLRLPGVKEGAEVLFEGRKVGAQGGTVEDEFAPMAVHVYQW